MSVSLEAFVPQEAAAAQEESVTQPTAQEEPAAQPTAEPAAQEEPTAEPAAQEVIAPQKGEDLKRIQLLQKNCQDKSSTATHS